MNMNFKTNRQHYTQYSRFHVVFFIFVILYTHVQTHTHAVTVNLVLSFEFQLQYWSKWQLFGREMSLQ